MTEELEADAIDIWPIVFPDAERPNYAKLTIQQLEDALLQFKRIKLAITAEQRVIQAIRRDKLDVMYFIRRMDKVVPGLTAEETAMLLTPEQVRELLATMRLTVKPGDVVVTPGPAVLTVETGQVEVEASGD